MQLKAEQLASNNNRALQLLLSIQKQLEAKEVVTISTTVRSTE